MFWLADILLLLDLLRLLLNLRLQWSFRQPFPDSFADLYNLLVSIEYLLQFIITDLHLFFIVQHFSQVLLASEAEHSITFIPKHKRMLGSITMLI